MFYIQLPKKAIRIFGKDNIKFLQGQLTQDLGDLNDEVRLTARLNIKGRVIFIGHVFQKNDDIYLIVDQDFAELAIADLTKYKMRSKVFFEIDEDVNILGLYGDVNEFDLNVYSYTYSIHLKEIYSFENFNLNFQILSYEDWLERCLLDSVVILPFDKREMFLIQELDLQNKAVSFKKGCYLGQEIVARVEYKGKLKKKLKVILEEEYQNQKIISSSRNHHLVLS